MSQVYIDYKIYTQDFYAQTKWEAGEEEAVWNIKYHLTNTNYSDLLCYHNSNNGYGDGSGYWWRPGEEEVWNGTCLDTEDALTIYLEGWENDKGDLCDYDTGLNSDDSHASDSDTDNDISTHARNTIESIYTDGEYDDDQIDCGSNGNDNLYQLRFKIWWNYSLPQNPMFSIDNIAPNSFTITKTSDNYYRINSWDYLISTDNTFTQIVQSGTDISSSSAQISGLNRETTYYIKIRGTNEAGTGEYSNSQQLQTLAFVAGDGTPEDPYEITSLQDLEYLTNNSDLWVDNYIQTVDIDAATTNSWNDGAGWKPIGESFSTPFYGSYDGNNHHISNLYINRSESSFIGFMGCANDGSIKNLGLINVDIIGKEAVGGLCGYSQEDHTIDNCYVSGNITGEQKTGGLAGYSSGDISNSYANINITSGFASGGLLGCLYTSGQLESCYAIVTIVGSSSVGGLVGITNQAVINNCYANHDTQAEYDIGGLVGTIQNTIVNNCYCIGDIIVTATGYQSAASFIGSAVYTNSVSNSYAIGNITYSGGNYYTTQGFVSNDIGTNTYSGNFFNEEVSNQTSGAGATALSTAQMQSLSTFVNAGWNMVGQNGNDNWDIDGATNVGYPFFSYQKPRIQWLGSTSTDPATLSNWSNTILPDPTDNILIIAESSNPFSVNNVPSSPKIYNSIAIESGATLYVEPAKALTVSNILFNNGNIFLQSNENGTGSLIVQKEALGDISTQRYIAAAEWGNWQDGWHFISSSVANYPIENNFTVANAADYDFYAWSEPDNEWINYKDGVDPTFLEVNGSNNFVLGRGYMAAYKDADTKSFTGEINIGDVTISNLTISSGKDVYYSWHLLGNPFSSALTWDESADWDKTNIAGTAQIWNEDGKSYSAITSGDVIPATNAFMVQVGSTGGSLIIPSSKRLHSPQPFYKSTNFPRIKLKAINLDNSSFQESQILFNPESTIDYEMEFDCDFLAGYAPKFYSQCDGRNLCVNSLPECMASLKIPFTFIKNEGLNFSIQMYEVEEMMMDVWLLDKKNGNLQNLTQKPIYVFTSYEGDEPDRFEIQFATVGVEELTNSGNTIQFWVTNKGIHILNPDQETGTISLLNVAGQLLGKFELNGNSSQEFGIQQTSGIYIITIQSDKVVLSNKIFIR